jgi:hypothetical protein
LISIIEVSALDIHVQNGIVVMLGNPVATYLSVPGDEVSSVA